jgi:hypothetical protein
MGIGDWVRSDTNPGEILDISAAMEKKNNI